VSRILVPLDESELAEEALPWAAALARGLGASLHLATIWTHDEDIWLRAGVDASAAPARIAQALDEYLAGVAARPAFEGLTVTYESRIGDVAEDLRDIASEGETRLVVITSHGRSGLRRMVQGSIADALVRTTHMPVLVVRPGERPVAFRRLLCTLDGSETGELALPVARELANALGASLHLLRVVNPVGDVVWSGVGPAPDLAQLTDQLTEAAQAYLAEKSLPGETTDVLYGRPLDAILECADTRNCDAIVMGTHGRGGIVRLALGSTTDAVVRASTRPVLVVPPSDRD
jgi:nucleotide-binding universal stress UspA family protein